MKKILSILLLITAVVQLLVSCTVAPEEPEVDNSGGQSTDQNNSQDVESGSDENVNVQEFTVKRGELNIYGRIYLPENSEEKMPAVILSHSSSLTSDSMKSYCTGFASRGYVAYAFDFCGGSSKSRSDGEEADMTVFTEVEDLKAVMEAIRSLEYVDENRVYLFGTSQGGLVSALTAEECPDEVKGMILLYPAFNIADLVRKFSAFGSGGSAFTETLKDYDVYEHIGGYTGNILIIHGSSDFIVPVSSSQKVAGIYQHCVLSIIDGANHGFNSENYSFTGNYDTQVWEYIDGYLANVE